MLGLSERRTFRPMGPSNAGGKRKKKKYEERNYVSQKKNGRQWPGGRYVTDTTIEKGIGGW